VQKERKMKRAISGITCFAFNKDFSMVALSPNNEEVHIYKTNSKKDCKKWEPTPTYILTEVGESTIPCSDVLIPVLPHF